MFKSEGAGKGDSYRAVNLKQFGESHERIFMKKKAKKKKKGGY